MTDWQMVGSLADWSTAGIALLALIVATIAGVATWKTNRAQQETLELQRKQYQATQDQLERAQASKVTCHLTGASTGQSEPAVLELRGHDTALLLNASDSPVYWVMLVQSFPEKRVLHQAAALFPTGQTPTEWTLTQATHWGPSWVKLYFRDAVGVHWCRSPGGELQKVSGQEMVEYSLLDAGLDTEDSRKQVLDSYKKPD